MQSFPLTMYIFVGVFGYNNVYSLEFLLTGVMGQDLFYNVFRYFVFPAFILRIRAKSLFPDNCFAGLSFGLAPSNWNLFCLRSLAKLINCNPC
jgi:hypothetical protein